jgi:hypothetical protein
MLLGKCKGNSQIYKYVGNTDLVGTRGHIKA